MTKIKICGITNKKDALAAAGFGVDMLGFVFYPKSDRFVDVHIARDIANELPPYLGKVGVFVNEKADKVRQIAEDSFLDMLQFHGDETPEYCENFRNDYKVIKAIRPKSAEDVTRANLFNVDFILFDTFAADIKGGTGKVFDWKLLKDAEVLKPVILSGGLTPVNIGRAIKEIAPYGVDVSSGVESSPGKKNSKLMKKFIEEVRKLG